MKVVHHPAARRELREALRYYEERCEGLGFDLQELVDRYANALPERHALYRHRPGGYQRVNLPRFPYYLPYVVRRDTLFVLAVAHATSEPEYWIDRVPE